MKIKILSFVLIGLVFVFPVFASAANVTGQAWSNQIGWINFSVANGNVQLSNTALTGAAWNTNYGWINFQPATGGVTNTALGDISGYAWSANLGWIDFSGVSVDCAGSFSGTATGTNVGTIYFVCAKCGVNTTWERENCPRGGSGSSSSSGGGGSDAGNGGIGWGGEVSSPPSSSPSTPSSSPSPSPSPQQPYFQPTAETASLAPSVFIPAPTPTPEPTPESVKPIIVPQKPKAKIEIIRDNAVISSKKVLNFSVMVAKNTGNFVKESFSTITRFISNIFNFKK